MCHIQGIVGQVKPCPARQQRDTTPPVLADLDPQQNLALELERDRLSLLLKTAEDNLRKAVSEVDTREVAPDVPRTDIAKVDQARLAYRHMHSTCGLWVLNQKGFRITEAVHKELRVAATEHL